MKEYFIMANSFAAPFFSDSSSKFVKAGSPKDALELFAAQYRHPAGLYAAACYESADAYHKNTDPVARWLSNRVIEQEKATKGLSGYSLLGIDQGTFEVNGKRFTVDNPREGRVV